jgi:GNAT superfamily N-acetyltransferase
VASWIERIGEESPFRQEIDKNLATFNDANSPWHRTVRASGGEAYDVYLVDENNQLIAGLYGEVYWDGLEIDRLWVNEAYRHTGLGTQMLNKALKFGRSRKVSHAHLTTFSFQAPEFYLKHGFKVVGEMVDMPPGHSKFWLRKELNE